MWVKICGTTSQADAQLAIDHGADALGFIFAPSKRRVTAEQAAEIIASLPPDVERVGVFTEASIPAIVTTVQRAALTAVQLHLPHDLAFTGELHARLGEQVQLIQVIGVAATRETDDESSSTWLADALKASFGDPALWAVLLDTVKDGSSGGLGVAFSWKQAKPALDQARADWEAEPAAPGKGENRRRLILAGGLHSANVHEAITALRPWGVDCVSGVEASPGKKDPSRLSEFIAASKTSALAESP